MDKMREEFEEWAVNTKNQFDLPFFIIKKADGIYVDRGTEISWQAWQASRQALVVELPAPCYRAEYTDYCNNSLEWDNYYEIDEVKSALSEAGIKCT